MKHARRSALKALAAIPFAAPLARAFASPGAPPPARLVILMQNNGTQQANFWPDAAMRSPILDALFLDGSGTPNGLAAKANVVKGVYTPNDLNGTIGNQHDIGFARLFTGEKLMSLDGKPWGGGPSVDQILAKEWDAETLTLAVLASQYEPFPKPGFNHRRSFSYVGPATLKYPAVDPLRVYRKLFSIGEGIDVRRRLMLRRSVLDAVSGNLSEVASRLGGDDARKLDYHTTAIRDVERRLSQTLASQGTQCTATPTRPRDFLALDPAAEISAEAYVPEMVDNMVDICAVALGCGLTRIATIQFGFGGGKWGFAWKGINEQFHDYIAHVDTSDAGSSPENTAKVVAANQYYASRVARLAVALDAIPEGNGTLLDSTLLVWGNELGRGDHDLRNVPIVLLGRVGQGIPRGGRTIDAGPQVMNRLGCTILNLMGKAVPGFGDEPTCGMFAGLV